MKIFQTLLLICFVAVSASAQRSDIKGPKAKNLKVHEHPELFSGQLVTQSPSTLKGAARKNFKITSIDQMQPTVAVTTRPRTEQGPKAKNRKAWQ